MQHGMARHKEPYSLSWGRLWGGHSGKLQGTRRIAPEVWEKGVIKSKNCLSRQI